MQGVDAGLAARFQAVRRVTEELVAPLSAEDCGLQSMPDASPAKWHLAHTTWFFETFVLADFAGPRYRPLRAEYRTLFNSYYQALGGPPPPPRAQRGLLSRPTLAEVRAYRRHVDAAVVALLAARDPSAECGRLIELGIHHEQQHQELLLADLKHAFFANPLRPAYRDAAPGVPGGDAPIAAPVFRGFRGALRWIGHPEEGAGFAFDNEGPRHRVFVNAFELATRPVTCAEYTAFMADGGYARPVLWLADGWATRTAHGWTAPLYWEQRAGAWWHMTLAGMRRIDGREPVCHVSWYEADAYARWAGGRLPTEAEWETAAAADALPAPADHYLESGRLHPAPVVAAAAAMGGDVWTWTASAYAPYPGYRPLEGALGEYNGKFMCDQVVLRGGSCVTPRAHARPTYRNFFPPATRWQFSGIRLAR